MIKLIHIYIRIDSPYRRSAEAVIHETERKPEKKKRRKEKGEK